MPSEFQNGGIDSIVVITVIGKTILSMLCILLPLLTQTEMWTMLLSTQGILLQS